MRFAFAFCLLAVSTPLLRGHASRGTKPALKALLSQKVSNYEDSGHDFPTTINDLMQKYRVPAGIDLETLSDRRPISVTVPQGTVADVLNAIVAQEPGFKWAEEDGAVNIGPQQNDNSVLNVHIAHFYIRRANLYEIKPAIVSLPEVKKWLEDNQLTQERETESVIGAVSPGKPFKPLISLDLQDATLRAVMNRIITSPGYGSWIVSRYGEKNQHMMIGID